MGPLEYGIGIVGFILGIISSIYLVRTPELGIVRSLILGLLYPLSALVSILNLILGPFKLYINYQVLLVVDSETDNTHEE